MTKVLTPSPNRVARSATWRAEFVRANGGRCHYCNRRGTSAHLGPDDRPWHVDHKKPLAKGGSDDDANLVLACKRCNLAKGVQHYDHFRMLARAAFWAPDDWRVSEFDLGELVRDLALLHGHEDGERWLYEDRPDGCTEVFALIGDGERVVIFRDGDSSISHWAMRLAMDAHRLLPAMIAEIRLLRAEREAELQAEDA